MAPQPKPPANSGIPPLKDEDIVISGLAGQYPDCDDVYQLRDHLMNKVDLVTADDRRWKLDHPEVPPKSGKLNAINKFDASFFGVHYKQAHTMDPMSRMLLERAYEAIVDAGVNPRSLRNKQVGVFVGAGFSESEKTWFYEKLQLSGFGITGCCRAMLANRISYWLGVKGPSYSLDTACSSSSYALAQAYEAIRTGQCESAVVGGVNLVLHPYLTLQFARLGVLSPEGFCRPFDDDANGYARSEAVVALYLQKAKDAKRVYASVVHAAVNCDGYKEQGITYPSGAVQAELLRSFYKDCGIDPCDLAYVEAHGTGTKVGDPEELKALDDVFCKEPGRQTPLLIGSIKSNIGHTEPASGLCSVSKVIIAMETGVIPPNIHVKKLRRGVSGFSEGRLKVVTEKTEWSGGLAAINSFGFGGANAHVLLRSNAKAKKDEGRPADGLPRLILLSGRTEEAVRVLADATEQRRPPDAEFVRLLHDVHASNIPGHVYRGYTVVGCDETPKTYRDIQYFGERRPVWFVFSGMGSQWPAMGRSLMQLPIFASAVLRIHRVLAPRGLDIVHIITSDDPTILDNILNCFVGIATVQVGLVDVLRAVGIEPDGIVGHSVGELGCAYADGCLTAEQTVLAAYCRGRASLEAPLISGAMAAVGMGASALISQCPADVDVACHNGPDSATISGPAASLRAFVKRLQARGVFAKEVACGNIAYHSRYIVPAGELLRKYLQEVIPSPKKRSDRWVSSSVKEEHWKRPEAQVCSAEYQTNNLLNSVLFEEAIRKIPSHAVTVEISPHGLLQAILKRSLSEENVNVALTRRGTDSLYTLLEGIGKLYIAGAQPQVAAIYPDVEFPVSCGTPMISPLVRWEHSDDWFVTSFRMQEKATSGERTVTLSFNDEDVELMDGHIIDGRPLVPATGYLKFVWETMAMLAGQLYTDFPVVFEDVRFLRATHLPREGTNPIDLTIMVQKGSGRFEVSDKGTTIVTGLVRGATDEAKEKLFLPPDTMSKPTLKKRRDDNEEEGEENPQDKESKSQNNCPAPPGIVDSTEIQLDERDVYKVMRLRGYNYTGLFRGIASASPDGLTGCLRWNSNWVSFLDAILQMKLLSQDSNQLYVPTAIQKLTIFPQYNIRLFADPVYDAQLHSVRVIPELDVTVTGGIELRGLYASLIARRRPLGDPVLENYAFVAYDDHEGLEPLSLKDGLRVCLHLLIENQPPISRTSSPIKIIELLSPRRQTIAETSLMILADLPLVQGRASIYLEEGASVEDQLDTVTVVADASKLATERDVSFLLASELSRRPEVLKAASTVLMTTGCVAALEASDDDARDLERQAEELGFKPILRRRVVEGDVLVLLRKAQWLVDEAQLHVVHMTEGEDFEWLPRLQEAMRDPNPAEKRVLLVSQGQPFSGILGFVNCVHQEPGHANRLLRCYFMPEAKGLSQKDAKALLNDPEIRRRIEADLLMNVQEGGVWGSMRHLELGAILTLPAEHAYCDIAVPGDLSSFTWLQGCLSVERAPGAVPDELIHVYYAALNFRDVMLASGKLNADVITKRFQDDCLIGIEFSGRTRSGRRVMGLNSGGSMANITSAKKTAIWDVPLSWTLAEAATVPVAYATAIFALDLTGNMKKGDSVLIHAGSGAVGQAAINLSLFTGCRVFVTVGTPEKKKFLLDHFPQLDPEDIGNSRDTSFEYMVMQRTGGKGVDLVLNSLAEDKLQASLRCLGEKGRFLEIGKVDLVNNSNVGMRMLLRQTSIHGILLDKILDAKCEEQLVLQNRLKEHLRRGSVKPIIYTSFERDQVENAYRYMAGGKHIGKVILRIRDEEDNKVTKPSPLFLQARPRFLCKLDFCYVICGGLGGLGLELSHWLVNRGARHLLLTSRRGVVTGYQSRLLLQWRRLGVDVQISTEEAATENGAISILRQAQAMKPVAAIFNLAAVLRDGLLVNQTVEAFRESYRCKGAATANLDAASRRLCPALRHFVVFSSVSCGRGNAGQTNYGFSNAVMERVIRARRAAGLPATAVQWGAVGDVGLVADKQDDDRQLDIGGTLQQRLSSCLEVLDGFLALPQPVLSSMVVAEKKAAINAQDLVSSVAALIGIRDLKTVSPDSPLAELGMDSMMAVEVQQALTREFDVMLTPQDVRALSFKRLMEIQRQRQQQSATQAQSADKLQAAAAVAKNKESLTGWPGPSNLSTISEQLKLLVRAIGDELTFSQPIVGLSSLVSSGSVEEEKVDSAVLMFPGLEGVAQPLQQVAKYLSYPVLCLQLAYREVDPNVQAMTDSLMPLVQSRVDSSVTSRGFAMVGYSFGGLIALEVAARLEASELGGDPGSGRLVLLDSAPDFMATAIRLLLEEKAIETEEEELYLQVVIVTHIIRTSIPDMTPEDVQALREEVESLSNWQQRLELFARRYPQTEFSHRQKMDLMDALYKRLLAGMRFHWTHKRPLQARVTLVRPSVGLLPPDVMTEDYGLSKICARKVEVIYVDGVDHYSMLLSKTTGMVINSILQQMETDEALIFTESIANPDINYYRGLHSTERG